MLPNTGGTPMLPGNAMQDELDMLVDKLIAAAAPNAAKNESTTFRAATFPEIGTRTTQVMARLKARRVNAVPLEYHGNVSITIMGDCCAVAAGDRLETGATDTGGTPMLPNTGGTPMLPGE